MSHNDKYYRKKIGKSGEKCAKIDTMFKMQALKATDKQSTSDNLQPEAIPSTSTASEPEVIETETADDNETGTGATETGSGVTETGSGVTETGSGVTETGTGATETGTGATETGSGVTETGSTNTDVSDSGAKKVSDKSPYDKRIFDMSHYEQTYDWLYYSSAREGFICKVCEFSHPNKDSSDPVPYVTVGVALGTHPSRKLLKHDESKQHKTALSRYISSRSGKTVYEMLVDNKQRETEEKRVKNRQYMNILFKSAYFLIRKKWALSDNLKDFMVNYVGSDLENNLVRQHMQERPDLTYTSPSSVMEIVQSLGFAFEKENLDWIRNVPCYALLADESTDEGNRTQFAVIIKACKNASVIDYFLGLINVKKTDAASLMLAIEQLLLQKQLNIKRAIFVGFDGCNVMSGVNNGLQRRFRHLVPHQLYLNCRNHKLALCVKHLIKDFPALDDLDNMLLLIWKMFHYSPEKSAVFMDIQQTYGQQKLKFIKAASTRWLSHGRACQRLIDRYIQILDSIDEIYDRKRDPEIMGLREMLTDKKVVATAVVLCDMLSPVIIFSDYLQGDVNFTRVAQKLKNLTEELHHLTNRFTQVAQGQRDPELYLSRIGVVFAEIDDRVALARRLRNRVDFTVEEFIETVANPMVFQLINELEDAFHCSPVLGAFDIFDMKNLPVNVTDLYDFGGNHIKTLSEHYGRPKEDVYANSRTVAQPVYPADNIEREYGAFKHQMMLLKQRNPDAVSEQYFLLKTLEEDDVLSNAYPSMHYLVKMACLIPTSTAVVERFFSLMNGICTPLRTSLLQETLAELMRVTYHGEISLTQTQLETAITHFFEMKDRKMEI